MASVEPLALRLGVAQIVDGADGAEEDPGPAYIPPKVDEDRVVPPPLGRGDERCQAGAHLLVLLALRQVPPQRQPPDVGVHGHTGPFNFVPCQRAVSPRV